MHQVEKRMLEPATYTTVTTTASYQLKDYWFCSTISWPSCAVENGGEHREA